MIVLQPDPLRIADMIVGISVLVALLIHWRCAGSLARTSERRPTQARSICRLIGLGHSGLNIRPRSSTRCVYAPSATNWPLLFDLCAGVCVARAVPLCSLIARFRTVQQQRRRRRRQQQRQRQRPHRIPGLVRMYALSRERPSAEDGPR